LFWLLGVVCCVVSLVFGCDFLVGVDWTLDEYVVYDLNILRKSVCLFFWLFDVGCKG